MDWHRMLPDTGEFTEEALACAREIRLRPGQPLMVLGAAGWQMGKAALAPKDVERAAQALSGYALAAWNRELSRGFLPLPGGHRLGVCGRMGERGLLEITSLCLRMAHEVKGIGQDIFPLIQGKNTLIAGPPGSGKTTLLRDLIRLYSCQGWQVGIADERGEIAACREGKPEMDVGPMADAVTGMEKAAAILLLLRSMSPQVVAADELGGPEDAQAVLEALRCGAAVLCTVHGRDRAAIEKRRGMEKLMEAGAFERLIMLSGPGMPWTIEEVGECN